MNAARALARAGMDSASLREALHPVRPEEVWLWPASALVTRRWKGGVRGMTWGRLVLVHPEVLEGDPVRLGRLALHELVHVRQFSELGRLRFGARYLLDYLRGRLRGLGHRQAYLEIRFEVEARQAVEELGGGGRGG